MLYLYRRQIIDRLIQLLTQHTDQIEHAVLFGSTITGTHHPDSDIDLFVVANSTLRPLLEQELDSIYIETTIPVVMIFLTPTSYKKSKKDPLIETILKEGVRIV
ncbi:MAG: nucleotidyltransferase domain-containing protein [Candidatus Heimdallarchaeota archaeon]